MSLSIEGEGLLRQSLSLLHSCGREHNECVVVWLARASRPERVTRVVHPIHTSHHGGYQIDSQWLDHLWRELARRGERIAAQAHTHPGRAFHSRTDDRFPIAWQPGLYSLVIPDFARQPSQEQEWYLTQLDPDGRWNTQNWLEITR